MKNRSRDPRTKQLQPIPQCIDCLLSLVRDATAMASNGNPRLMEQMESEAKGLLDRVKDLNWTSPRIANTLFNRIRRVTENADPYREFKAREMAQAGRIFERIRGRLPRDLKGRVRTAVAGNSFDFFKDPDTLYEDIFRFATGADADAYDHTDRLAAFLESEKTKILYVTDNAGEIYFDQPLFTWLKMKQKTPVLVVKGGPALNDLTRADLEGAGLTPHFDAVEDTGADGAGIDWDRVSEGFLNRVETADLVISKGMANFETIFPKTLPCPVLFLFRVKCAPIQNFISAALYSGVILWKDPAVT